MADPERMRSREHEGERGKRSLELPEALVQGGVRLLPTPTAGDGKASGSRNLEGSKAHPGVSLTDAVQTGDSRTPRLLPTPQAADGDGGRQERGAMANHGERPSGQKATLPLPTAVGMRDEIAERPFARPAGDGQLALLPTPTGYAGESLDGQLPTEIAMLPTPVANPENPGAGGELRAALVHGEGRRNDTGVDTLGRPNEGRPSRLLPTPNAEDGVGGRTRLQHKGGNPTLQGALLSEQGLAVPDETGRLLPTPTTQDGENTAGPSQRDRRSDPLNVVAADLLPTPTAADGDRTSEQGPRHYIEGDDNPTLLGAARRSEVEWGVYEGAVRRWETVFGRSAPAPTDEKGRLAPEFVEWMLGYPENWFDVVGVSRTRKLRALGNSVQVQCAEAVGYWLAALLDSGLLLDEAATG